MQKAQLKIGVIILLGILLTANMWMAEDAFIPLRVVNQFWARGPVWNMGERVQVCTSLLWQFLLLPGYWIINPEIWTCILSIGLSIGFFKIVSKKACIPVTLFLLVLYCMSPILQNNLGSGLEGPLTALLIVWCITCYTKNPDSWEFALALGCLPLARHDIGIIALPFLIERSVRWIRAHNWRNLAITAAPLILLTLFSLIYFGALLPNTYYAKVGADVPMLPDRNYPYFLLSLKHDPSAVILVLATFIAGIMNDKKLAILGLASTLLYSGYIIHTGDYMLGRFFLPISALSLILFALARPHPNLVWITMALMTAAWVRTDQIQIAKEIAPVFLENERPCGHNTPIQDIIDGSYKGYQVWYQNGLALEEQGTSHQGAIGLMGYAAPNSHHICDVLALSDPLLARIPASYHPEYRPGHAARTLTSEFFQYTITKNPEKFTNPEIRTLAQLLKKTHGQPLFSMTRLDAIHQLSQYELSAATKFQLTFPDIKPTISTEVVELEMHGAITPLPPSARFIDMNINQPVQLRYLKNFVLVKEETRLVPLGDGVITSKIPKGATDLQILPNPRITNNIAAGPPKGVVRNINPYKKKVVLNRTSQPNETADIEQNTWLAWKVSRTSHSHQFMIPANITGTFEIQTTPDAKPIIVLLDEKAINQPIFPINTLKETRLNLEFETPVKLEKVTLFAN